MTSNRYWVNEDMTEIYSSVSEGWKLECCLSEIHCRQGTLSLGIPWVYFSCTHIKIIPLALESSVLPFDLALTHHGFVRKMDAQRPFALSMSLW